MWQQPFPNRNTWGQQPPPHPSQGSHGPPARKGVRYPRHVPPRELSQMPPSGRWTTFARYVSGTLETVPNVQIGVEPFIAISHVWGADATWQSIPGVSAVTPQIKVSPEKRKFIVEQLPLLVGASLFWMDILCVDQRDGEEAKASRVAITQDIPLIFRRARETIVVRSSGGFQDCCARMFREMSVPVTPEGRRIFSVDDPFRVAALEAMKEHVVEVHPQVEGGIINEVLLYRLWPLQELILSDVIRFVRCDPVPTRGIGTTEFDPRMISAIAHINSFARQWGWETRRSSESRRFINAFINNGTVERVLLPTPPYPDKSDLSPFRDSMREATVARDYILAVMPQYQFYSVPINATSANRRLTGNRYRV